MEYYSDRLRKATLDLNASRSQLDLDILNLPLTSSPDHRNAIISRLNRQHYARRSNIKHGYGVPDAEEATPEDFTFPFSEFPQEIQDLIWNFILPGPRIVPILHKQKVCGLISPCAPPVALHICRASREIALKSGYELAFRTSKYPAPIYFNFAFDTLYIDNVALVADIVGHGETDFSCEPSSCRIKRLALGLSVSLQSRNPTYWIFPCLARYTSLETLFITTYLCDEWLSYGDLKPTKVTNVLIPHLGQKAVEWRTAFENAQRDRSPHLRIPTVNVLLLTNLTLRPWMCSRVLRKWDTSLAKALKTSKPEYVLDPTQVTAVARCKLAVFDSIACACDAEYAEKVYARYDPSCGRQWEMQLRERMRTYSVSYY